MDALWSLRQLAGEDTLSSQQSAAAVTTTGLERLVETSRVSAIDDDDGCGHVHTDTAGTGSASYYAGRSASPAGTSDDDSFDPDKCPTTFMHGLFETYIGKLPAEARQNIGQTYRSFSSSPNPDDQHSLRQLAWRTATLCSGCEFVIDSKRCELDVLSEDPRRATGRSKQVGVYMVLSHYCK